MRHVKVGAKLLVLVPLVISNKALRSEVNRLVNSLRHVRLPFFPLFIPVLDLWTTSLDLYKLWPNSPESACYLFWRRGVGSRVTRFVSVSIRSIWYPSASVFTMNVWISSEETEKTDQDLQESKGPKKVDLLSHVLKWLSELGENSCQFIEPFD